MHDGIHQEEGGLPSFYLSAGWRSPAGCSKHFRTTGLMMPKNYRFTHLLVKGTATLAVVKYEGAQHQSLLLARNIPSREEGNDIL